MKMKQRKHLWAIILLTAWASTHPAHADVIDVVLAGTTSAGADYFDIYGACPIVVDQFGDCMFPAGTPFFASLLFDTSLGTLASPSPGVYVLYGGPDTSYGGRIDGPIVGTVAESRSAFHAAFRALAGMPPTNFFGTVAVSRRQRCRSTELLAVRWAHLRH
jgi:hypothetical protein